MDNADGFAGSAGLADTEPKYEILSSVHALRRAAHLFQRASQLDVTKA
jgi:hypothetical protein